jgi:hypothetical protein
MKLYLGGIHMDGRREFERYRPSTKDVKVCFGDNKPQGNIVDISKSGVLVWNCNSREKNIQLKFRPNNKKPIIRKSFVAREIIKDKQVDSGVALHFEKPLSEFELKRIKENDPSLYLPGEISTYDLARIDRTEVFRESNQIKTCSSNYFIWAIGFIVPFTVAIWSLFLSDTLNVFAASSSMIGIMIVFSAALFSNIEKSRAINKREGFNAALDYYLKMNEGPQDYRGWVNLKYCLAECKARIDADLCPINKDTDQVTTCQKIGANKSKLIRSNKKLIPAILDSFISLTSFFYALIYLGLCILTVMSFSKTWQKFIELPPSTTLTWFIVGFFMSILLYRRFLLLVVAIVTVIGVIMAGVVITNQSLIKVSSLGIGMILGSIGWYFIKHLYGLRKGMCSFETYTHTWLEIFENCVFLPEDATNYEPSPSFFSRLNILWSKTKKIIKLETH